MLINVRPVPASLGLGRTITKLTITKPTISKPTPRVYTCRWRVGREQALGAGFGCWVLGLRLLIGSGTYSLFSLHLQEMRRSGHRAFGHLNWAIREAAARSRSPASCQSPLIPSRLFRSHGGKGMRAFRLLNVAIFSVLIAVSAAVYA